jgi:hypothetical protein
VVEWKRAWEGTPTCDSLWAPTLRESAQSVSLGERVDDRYDVQLNWVPSRSGKLDVFSAGCTAVETAELGGERKRVDSVLSLASDCV